MCWEIESWCFAAFLPRLERSFARVTAFVAEHSEQLRAQNKKALVDTFGSKDMQPIPMSCFWCRASEEAPLLSVSDITLKTTS